MCFAIVVVAVYAGIAVAFLCCTYKPSSSCRKAIFNLKAFSSVAKKQKKGEKREKREERNNKGVIR